MPETPDDALEEFLRKKRIDPASFVAKQPQRFARLKAECATLGSASLDYSHKFQWNDLRLEFPLAETPIKKD